ncbi:MAG: M50 family metallopeptidase [Clostridia bacterium]|nr:M50 family metallopeptidase [Clostridia bacterium]
MTKRIKTALGACLTFGRVQLQLSAIALFLLLFVGGNAIVFFSLISAAALHEAGHLTVIKLLGFKVDKVSVTALGAAIHRKGLTGFRHDIFIAAAGPLFSAAAFAVSYAFYASGSESRFLSLFCGLNLILCLLNLVPAWPLDGGVMLLSALYQRYDEKHARFLAFYISLSASLTLFVLGGILLYHTGYNISLILISLFLLYGVSRFEELV